jgi:ubiquitin thioesterase protein OTUB1
MQLVASKLLPLTRPAIAFTYFEALLRLGDGQRFADEEGRLTSMANLLDNIGYHRDIWIDFADEAYELLRKLGSSVDAMDGTGPDILLQAFNDQSTSMSIITYFKVSSNYRRFID